jgi:hypothetical protein
MKAHVLARPAGTLVFAFAVACASGPPRVDEQRVVALPRQERQALIDEERNVDVAQANLVAARTSLDQAKLFQGLVEHEVDSAEANREAAEEALELARSSHDQTRIQEVEQKNALWERRLNAARTKADYAERLVELREAEMEERTAAVKLATVQFERTKYEKVKQRGMGGGLDGEDFMEAFQEAQEEHTERHAETEQLRDGVQASRTKWDQARAQWQELDQRVEDKAFRAPPEPKYLQQQAKQLEPVPQQPPQQQQPQQ